MIDPKTTRGGASSTIRISEEIGRVWAGYSRSEPSSIETEISGDTVTCRLVDAVGSFNQAMAAPGSRLVPPTLDSYRHDATAAVVGVTRQRVTRLMSSHDEDTDVATEIFTLDPGSETPLRPRSKARRA